jgi:hypothetical protein
MKEILIDSLSGMAATGWIGCVFVNLSLQLHYSVRKEGFFRRLFFASMKMDYTSVPEEMTPKDRRLYLLTFIGMFVLFLPGGYFVGSILNRFLK